MTIPDSQIRSLRIICARRDDADVMVMQEELSKFLSGEHVRVSEGMSKGVADIAAPYRGQQRVGIVIEGLLNSRHNLCAKCILGSMPVIHFLRKTG